MGDPSRLECGCVLFLEQHGRDELFVTDEGEPWCSECVADGWSGELCHPSPDSCCLGHNADKANEWHRSFMCADHAAAHRQFCAEEAA